MPQDAMISTVGLYVAFEKLLLDEDNKMKMEILLLFFFLFFFLPSCKQREEYVRVVPLED